MSFRTPGGKETMTGRIEQRIGDLGLVLPEPLKLPSGMKVPLAWVRVLGKRVLVSGHGPQEADGSIAQPLGQVGADGDGRTGDRGSPARSRSPYSARFGARSATSTASTAG